MQAIFERTYGAVKRESFLPPKAPKRPVADNSEEKRRELKQAFSGEDYLLVDGYNIIFAWDELKKMAAENLDAARKKLCDLLCNYQGYRKVPGDPGVRRLQGEGRPGQRRTVPQHPPWSIPRRRRRRTPISSGPPTRSGRQHRVRVATSDGPEQTHHPGPRGAATVGLRFPRGNDGGPEADRRYRVAE